MTQAAMLFGDIWSASAVRLVVIGNVQYLSVRDVIMDVCAVTPRGASQKWRNVDKDTRRELRGSLKKHQFSGRGQIKQDVITFDGALTLVMQLSGKGASVFRGKMSDVLYKYYIGDRDGSLAEAIDANAESTGRVQQMARASLARSARPRGDPHVHDFFRTLARGCGH